MFILVDFYSFSFTIELVIRYIIYETSVTMKKTIIPLLLCLLLLGACDKSTESFSTSTFAMDTYMKFTAYGRHGQSAVDEAIETVHELDARLSVTDSASEIYAYNSGDSDALGEETQALVDEALAIGARTDWAVDIRIYPLVRAWGFTTEEYRVPSQEEIDELLAEESTMLDLGAVAKGYAGDLIAAQMREAGVSSALLELSGNIHCVGTKPDGSLWTVAIQDPLDPSSYVGTVKIADMAVVTSGGYERHFEQDGVRYHHIIDPKTGYPAESGLVSVTVVCESGTLADALSTALFVMGLDDAMAHYDAYGDFEAIFVTQDDEVYITAGLTDSFTLLSERYVMGAQS